MGAFLGSGDWDFAGDGVFFGEQDRGNGVGWVVFDGHGYSFVTGSETCGCVVGRLSPRLVGAGYG